MFARIASCLMKRSKSSRISFSVIVIAFKFLSVLMESNHRHIRHRNRRVVGRYCRDDILLNLLCQLS